MGLIRPKTANSADKSSFAKPNWYQALFYPRCGVDTDYSDIFHPVLGIKYPIGGHLGGYQGQKMGLICPKTANSADKSSFVKPNRSLALIYLRWTYVKNLHYALQIICKSAIELKDRCFFDEVNTRMLQFMSAYANSILSTELIKSLAANNNVNRS